MQPDVDGVQARVADRSLIFARFFPGLCVSLCPGHRSFLGIQQSHNQLLLPRMSATAESEVAESSNTAAKRVALLQGELEGLSCKLNGYERALQDCEFQVSLLQQQQQVHEPVWQCVVSPTPSVSLLLLHSWLNASCNWCC